MKGDVLIVDDNPIILHLLIELLSAHDFEVRAVRSGEIALQAAREMPPDVILLDIRMPIMDGYEVCRQLKQDAKLHEVPVIFVSAADDIIDKVRAFKVGGVDYILRPFQEEEVIARVTTHVNLYRALKTAHELAVIQERQRLARELHDAVSQTLFSLSLTADIALRTLDSDSDPAYDHIQEIQQLTQEAKAEMRVLMYELRPESLHDAPLHHLLDNLASLLTGKIEVQLERDLTPVPMLPPDVTIAFYRIAQEALTNIIKHAKATSVQLSLMTIPGGVEMTIVDDGIGFDQPVVHSTRYGIKNMTARAESIGATHQLTSNPGDGTRVCTEWQEDAHG